MTEEEDNGSALDGNITISNVVAGNDRSIWDGDRLFAYPMEIAQINNIYTEGELKNEADLDLRMQDSRSFYSRIVKIEGKYYLPVTINAKTPMFGREPSEDIVEIRDGVVFPVERGVGGSACITTSAGAAEYGNSSVIIESPVIISKDGVGSEMPTLGAADDVAEPEGE